ncbi:MAG: hypothetical protein HY801_15090 [Candidatus Lindowbacteria bacterium]|nr:hypothetical protein [Candidatus Lindowbacteria bacterium]
MARVLLYHTKPGLSRQLQADLKRYGWSVDICDGMLEMLRMIEKENYEVVVLNANRLDMEIGVLVGSIEALKKRPKILLNFSEPVERQPSGFPALGFSVISGELTPAKFVEAAKDCC